MFICQFKVVEIGVKSFVINTQKFVNDHLEGDL